MIVTVPKNKQRNGPIVTVMVATIQVRTVGGLESITPEQGRVRYSDTCDSLRTCLVCLEMRSIAKPTLACSLSILRSTATQCCSPISRDSQHFSMISLPIALCSVDPTTGSDFFRISLSNACFPSPCPWSGLTTSRLTGIGYVLKLIRRDVMYVLINLPPFSPFSGLCADSLNLSSSSDTIVGPV